MYTNRAQRLSWSLLASALALLLLLGLSLLFSRFQAVAQPVAEVMALQVDKEVNTELAAPGDTLAYTITIYNAGGPAATAWFSDELPAELTYVVTGSLGANFGTPLLTGRVITWNEPVGVDQTARIWFSAVISPDIILADVVNTAQVTSSGELLQDSATTLVVAEMGELDNEDTAKTVTLPAEQTQVEPGDVLTYTIRVYNSDVAHIVPQAWLTDELPSGLSYVADSLQVWPDTGSYGFANGVLTWTDDVEPLDTILLDFNAQVSLDFPSDDWVVNTAEFVVPGQTFTRSVETFVHRPYGQLQAIKSVDPRQARPGERLTYTVHVTNVGDGLVERAWMTDRLPSRVTLVSTTLTATVGSVGAAGDVITWSSSLGPSGTLQVPPAAAIIAYVVEIDGDVSHNLALTNTAQITGAGALVEAHASAEAVTNYVLYFPIILHDYPPVPYLNPIPDPDANRSYTVSWQPIEVPFDRYVLQQSRAADFADPENEWETTDTSRGIQSAYCTFRYRVRVDRDDAWGQGTWSHVRTGQPSPPTVALEDIPDPDANNSYTVRWSLDSIPPEPIERFRLQESTRSDFSTITNEWTVGGGTTSQLVTKGASSGTFYYRVRAEDDDCWARNKALWSDIKLIVVPVRYDFNSSCSDWRIREHTGDDGPPGTDWFSIGCSDGKLEISVNDRWEHVIGSPLKMSPDRPYEIQTSIYFKDRSWSSGYALVFGIRESTIERYYRINVVYLSAGAMKFQVKRCESDHCSNGVVISKGVPGADSSGYIQVDTSILNGQEWNAWRVRRQTDHIRIYANDHLLLDLTDDVYSGVGYFGLMVSTWEFKPATIWVDYYNVVPLN